MSTNTFRYSTCCAASVYIFVYIFIGASILSSLGNLPVERAKDAVCFLQWGGVSLASSAIIYNIVKVIVTR